MNDFDTFTKLHNNVGKIIVATAFEWLPKVQKIAPSGHTVHGHKSCKSHYFFGLSNETRRRPSADVVVVTVVALCRSLAAARRFVCKDIHFTSQLQPIIP